LTDYIASKSIYSFNLLVPLFYRCACLCLKCAIGPVPPQLAGFSNAESWRWWKGETRLADLCRRIFQCRYFTLFSYTTVKQNKTPQDSHKSDQGDAALFFALCSLPSHFGLSDSASSSWIANFTSQLSSDRGAT